MMAPPLDAVDRRTGFAGQFVMQGRGGKSGKSDVKNGMESARSKDMRNSLPMVSILVDTEKTKTKGIFAVAPTMDGTYFVIKKLIL
jgi:hypothetical protein